MEVSESINDDKNTDIIKEKKGEKEQKEKEKAPRKNLPRIFAEFFKLLLIIHLIILLAMFVLFGLNHLLLYVVSTTVTIRMLFGVIYNIPDYYNKGLYFTVWCFVFNAIEITIRFLVSFFTYKIRDNITDLREMKIIETNRFLWFKGFSISLDGLSTLIILGFFMAFWALLIVLFNLKKSYFDFEDRREDKKYLDIIQQFYEKHILIKGFDEGGELDS